VVHRDPNAGSAIRKSTALYEKLREELKKSKLKNLELASTEYSVFERKEWENNKNVSKGFECRMGLKATTTDLSALGDLIVIGSKTGITETHSLHIELSEAKALEEKKKCLDIAAKNAREKAEILVKSLNAKLGKVLQITELGATPPPMPMYEKGMMRVASMDAAPPGIEPQKQILNQTVDVTFAIE